MMGVWDRQGRLISKNNGNLPPALVRLVKSMGFTMGPVREDAETWTEFAKRLREELKPLKEAV